MALLTGEDRSAYVAAMFSRIARRYDLLNTLMSAGRHHAWRRMALEMALDGSTAAGRALDVASGTCDFPLAALSLGAGGRGSGDELGSSPAMPDLQQQWIAVDFSEPMLKVGRRKIASAGAAPGVTLLLSDAHALPFRDEAFSMATVGFGMRNFADRPAALAQIARVLKTRRKAGGPGHILLRRRRLCGRPFRGGLQGRRPAPGTRIRRRPRSIQLPSRVGRKFRRRAAGVRYGGGGVDAGGRQTLGLRIGCDPDRGETTLADGGRNDGTRWWPPVARDAGFGSAQRGRSMGKRITSRIDRWPDSSIVRRSMPIPSPPVGGIPCSTATRKSSSSLS